MSVRAKKPNLAFVFSKRTSSETPKNSPSSEEA